MAKILAGQAISVVIMGSSLTGSGGAATDWPGMVFGAGTIDKYKLPTTVNTKYTGVGGSPNQYQLAQLGFGSSHTGYGISGSGMPGALGSKLAPPNGRSALFSGVDLVVLGCLANGGDYRLETIEPMARKLRQLGVEVIMVTDNPQGPSTSFTDMTGSSLYVDGPSVMRVADQYGVELADTAAYVFEAHLRAGGVGIYGDTIHMAGGAPNGPNAAAPANGHEVWARAVRSIFHAGVKNTPPTTITTNYDFSTGLQGWSSYSQGLAEVASGTLVVKKNTAANNQWGAWLTLNGVSMKAGDTVDVAGTIAYAGFTPTVGLQGGGAGWGSNSAAPNAAGNFSVRLTATRDIVNPQVLLFGNWDAAPLNTQFTVDDLVITATTTATNLAFDAMPSRPYENRPIPPIRVVSDLKTPGDAFVILPKDEYYLSTGNAAKGTLGAHPWGSGSFSRKFGSYVGDTTDLLTLATGQKACISGPFAVGFALIHYRATEDGACAFTLSLNGAVKKTINVGAVPFANEWFLSLLTPTEANVSALNNDGDTYEIAVTAGTLKVAAFVALTPDMDFITADQITYVGAGWLPKEVSRSGEPGRPTDTVGDYAVVRCTGRRVAWVLSSNPGSKNADFFSDRESAPGIDTTGNFHVRSYGRLLGPGASHYVRCAQANAAGSQANGHALNISGAIIINDR